MQQPGGHAAADTEPPPCRRLPQQPAGAAGGEQEWGERGGASGVNAADAAAVFAELLKTPTTYSAEVNQQKRRFLEVTKNLDKIEKY